MSKRIFWTLFVLILSFSFVLRIIPAQNHNFFFTIDQADDGVLAREIFERGQLLRHGPQTNIPGVYSGPLWYYFVSLGYFLFGGDPFGALFMVILLNVGLVGILMYVLKGEIGAIEGLGVGFILQFFWWFYDSSRWAFNPFPLVFCAVVLILLLSLFLKTQNKKYYFLSAVPIFLAFNAEVAGATALFLFFIIFSIWAFWKRKIRFTKVAATSLVLSSAGAGVLFFQLTKRFLANQQGILPGISTGYLSGTDYANLAREFAQIFSYSVVPYEIWASLIIFLLAFYLFLKQRNRNKFVFYFVTLSFVLFAVSYLMFGATRGWYDWHTIYLPTVLFLSVVLVLLSLPKKVGVTLLVVIIFFQAVVFKDRYLQYLAPQEGPGILATQLKVLDWIYQNAQGDGFNVYTFAPSGKDYVSQYLFWWYGRKEYGFVPCEYSIAPGDLKLYVAGELYYKSPTLGCDYLRFLVIEQESGPLFEKWRQQVVFERGEKVEETTIGGYKVEKWWIRPRT